MNNNYGNGQLWVKAGIGGAQWLKSAANPPPPQNNNRKFKKNKLMLTFFYQSMDVAPAAAEVAVMTGAVVQGHACSSMQQRRHGCGSKQHALVELQAVADGGTITMDGRQPVCVQQRAVDTVCM
jgi:hypothetical protein